MNNNSIWCSSDSNPANLEKDHLQETSSSSGRSATTQDEGVFLLASSRPKKRAGRKKFKETRHPIYRGVRRRNNNKWVCELREPSEQKRIWLGTYPTPEMAARAHDVAALALRGNLATLNFADSCWKLPVPVSKDPKDLRQAAVKAAEAFSEDHELVEVDYMNHQEVNSSTEEVKHQEIDVVEDNGTGGNLAAKNLNLDMENILCCNWEENNEMLEMEGWREKMAEGLLFSPTPRLGRKKFKETRHPVYKGARRRNNDKWVYELRKPSEQRRIWLGTYPTQEMTARAHDVAALALRGNLATLNFADSRWRLPVPLSKDPKDLRHAAIKVAEAFSEDPELESII
ncbi:hypothetical protein K7X08_020501 [Anisodus acutangulus]|uniref:AP2/ERF domain-containing protein n=1 Tax=Anisodus acutangulus TaxID=402998 RepID=A0A9Q1M6J7_9SOLA|nr:hypothetical protein K7X08_020501 [Anisodus acutangulus]